jgi:hypothetical protein
LQNATPIIGVGSDGLLREDEQEALHFKVAAPIQRSFPWLAYGPSNTIAGVQDDDIPGRDTILLMKVYVRG